MCSICECEYPGYPASHRRATSQQLQEDYR
jgi:hypothetical protein